MHCKLPSFGDRWQSQPIYLTLRRGLGFRGHSWNSSKKPCKTSSQTGRLIVLFWDTYHEQICNDLDIGIDTSCDEVLQMLVDEKTLELTGPYVTMDELWIVFFCSRACNVDVATEMKFRRITAMKPALKIGLAHCMSLNVACVHKHTIYNHLYIYIYIYI